MATLSADDITQSRQGYTNNSLVEIQNFKSNLAGGDTDTAMVTDDHDSRSTDFTNLITSKTGEAVESCEDCRFYDGMNGDCKHPNHREGEELCPVARGEDAPRYHYAVRRITPIEGERLQGFADNWTRPCFTPDQITDELVDRFIGIHQNWAEINGKPNAKPKSREWVRNWLTKISSADCPDGPRYKAIGNSMSVNVMNWIGQRIAIADRRAK